MGCHRGREHHDGTGAQVEHDGLAGAHGAQQSRHRGGRDSHAEYRERSVARGPATRQRNRPCHASQGGQSTPGRDLCHGRGPGPDRNQTEDYGQRR